MNKHPQEEHGTIKSYVIGFILSLIFTFIPFFMVMNQKLATGNTLVAVILIIAFIQMIIQIFFFLHLGRGPKPFYNIVFFFTTAIGIVMVVGGSIFIMTNLYNNMSPHDTVVKIAQEEGISQVGGEDTGACSELFESHIVTIKDGEVTPKEVYALRCDTLTFVSEDDTERQMAFGNHNSHVNYGGEGEIMLIKGHPETITLNQTGEYHFHDHYESFVGGNLIVVDR